MQMDMQPALFILVHSSRVFPRFEIPFSAAALCSLSGRFLQDGHSHTVQYSTFGHMHSFVWTVRFLRSRILGAVCCGKYVLWKIITCGIAMRDIFLAVA